jgi:AcrR family transcriptional regulator
MHQFDASIEVFAVLPHRTLMSGNTRNRILVASLLLFNEHGEPGTTTNEIADEVDISPGNLHYHFPKKRQIVAALLDEFQADARRILVSPDPPSIDDFWVFLHLLLELTAAYRFLFRDLESLSDAYPKVARVLGHFAKGLTAIFELHLRGMEREGLLELPDSEAAVVARNLVVIALFSERLARLTGAQESADNAALRVASSILTALRPYANPSSSGDLEDIASRYQA